MKARHSLKHLIFYCAFLVFISHTAGYFLTLVQGKQPHYLSLPGAFSFSQSLLLYDRNEVFTWRQKFEVAYGNRVLTFDDSQINQKLSTLERHLFTLGDYEGESSRIKAPVLKYYFCDQQIQKNLVPETVTGKPLSVKWIFTDRTSTRTLAEVPCET